MGSRWLSQGMIWDMSLLKTSADSDKDYLKIFNDGQVTISANGSPDADSTFPADPNEPFGYSGSQTISHGLGVVPLVRAFINSNKDGRWYGSFRDEDAAQLDPWLNFIVTTSQLKLIVNTNSGSHENNIPVFYRIYDLGEKALDSSERIDKIFKKDNGSASVGAFSFPTPGVTRVTRAHNAGVAPLYTLQFSEDGSTWYNEGESIIGPPDTSSGPPGGPYSRYYRTRAYGSVDNNNMYISLVNDYETTKTIYYRYTLDYRS